MTRVSLDAPDAPLQLLLEWSDPVTLPRLLRAALPSLALNIVGAMFLISFVDSASKYEPPRFQVDLRQSTPLILPKRFPLTQKDPNRETPKNEITSSAARQPSPPKTRQFRPPVPATPATASRPTMIPEPPS